MDYGFIVKSEKFEEMKGRLRLVSAPIVGILLYSGIGMNFAPSKTSVKKMIVKWYPKATNIQVAITESKIETNTYKAYVDFNFQGGTSTCHTEVKLD